MTDDPAADRRTAAHEAGHAVALWRLTGTLPPTICLDPPVCFGFHRLPDFTDHDPAAPLCLARSALRRVVEAECIVHLAGREAGDLAAPSTGRLADPPEVVALARAAQSPEIRAALDAIKAEPPAPVILDDPRSDDAHALDLALQLAGMRANAYLAWCRVEAAAIVRANVAAIGRLAGELLQRRIMDDAAILAVLESEGATDADPA